MIVHVVNNQVLKDHVQGTGRKIILRDYMGKSYVYGPKEKESNVYPLFKASPAGGFLRDHNGFPIMPIVDLLLEQVKGDPDDSVWMTKLVISGTKLDSYLKAKSRAVLHQAIEDQADKITKVKMEISKPLDVIEPDDEFDEDEADFDDF